MKEFFTLQEFLKMLDDKSKLSGIYVDSDDLNIYAKLESSSKPLDVLKDYTNILSSDEYLKLEDNGEYSFDREKIYTKYSSYLINTYIPIIKSGKEDDADDIIENDELTEEDFITKIASVTDSFVLVLQSPVSASADPVFFPDPKSDIKCWVMMDFTTFDDVIDMSLMKEDPPIDGIYMPIAVITDDSKIKPFLIQRRGYFTSVYRFENGRPLIEKSCLYYTNEDGTLEKKGSYGTTVVDLVENLDDD